MLFVLSVIVFVPFDVGVFSGAQGPVFSPLNIFGGDVVDVIIVAFPKLKSEEFFNTCLSLLGVVVCRSSVRQSSFEKISFEYVRDKQR